MGGRLEFRRLLQLGTVAFVLHNGEEALTMPNWLASDFPRAIQQLGLPRLQPPSTERLYRGLVLVTVVPVLAVLVAAEGGPKSLGVYLCLILYGMLLWNALLPHLASTILLRRYVPGVATAALVNLPFVVYLFSRALRERQSSPAGSALALGVAAVCYSLGMVLLWSQWAA